MTAANLADWVRSAMRFIDLTEADCLDYSDQGMADDAARLTNSGYALFGLSMDATDTSLARLEGRSLAVLDQHADAHQEVMAALYKAWPHAEDIGDGTHRGVVGLIEQLTAERNALLEALKGQTAVSVRSMRRLGFFSEHDILDCTAQARSALELVTGDDLAGRVALEAGR